jgi:hypothetical protein
MPIVFDEVVGEIAPEPAPPAADARAANPPREPEQDARAARGLLRRIEQREARLRAD